MTDHEKELFLEAERRAELLGNKLVELYESPNPLIQEVIKEMLDKVIRIKNICNRVTS